jgi:hypothetical protein
LWKKGKLGYDPLLAGMCKSPCDAADHLSMAISEEKRRCVEKIIRQVDDAADSDGKGQRRFFDRLSRETV